MTTIEEYQKLCEQQRQLIDILIQELRRQPNPVYVPTVPQLNPVYAPSVPQPPWQTPIITSTDHA